MAEFEAQASAIRATGHELLALAVDDPARSEPVRQRLRLSFPILCDQRRAVVKAWDLFNEQERGGIAVPAVLVLDRDGTVRHAWTETVATRVTGGYDWDSATW